MVNQGFRIGLEVVDPVGLDVRLRVVDRFWPVTGSVDPQRALEQMMRIPGVYEPSLTRQSTLGASRSNNLRLGYRVQRIPQQTEMSPDRFHSRSKGHFGSFSPTVAVNPDTPSPLGSRQLTGHDTELLCSLGERGLGQNRPSCGQA